MKLEKKLKKGLVTMSKKAAEKGANQACYFLVWQPKESKAVKSMRKF